MRPPNLLKDESLRTIQRNLQEAFLLNGKGVAKRYLRFLLQRIEINGDEVRIEADTATLVAGGLQLRPSGDLNQLTPVLSVDYDWLPNRYNCKNSTEVVTFSLFRPEAHKAEKPLSPCPTRESAIRLALEFRRMLDDGVVRNQVEIARLRGLSRARVTQLVNIARLPQPILDCLLGLPAEQQTTYTERRLRRIANLPSEEEQLEAFEDLELTIDNMGS